MSTFSPAQADTIWTGLTSQDFNTASNWDNGLPGTGNNDAIVSLATGNYPILAGNATSSRDVRVGTGANGRLDQTAGTLNTGEGSWFWHGYLAANATYNLANTAATGGTYTGFGQGTGSINIGGSTKNGNLLAGLDNGTVSTVNVNTTGTLAAGGIFLGAAGGSNGHFNMDNGTVTVLGEFQVGANFFSQGSGTDNTYQQSGGTVTADIFSLARGANNAATMKGTATITGGTLNTLHWFTLGFAGAAGDTATVTNGGGTINVNTAAGGTGVLEMGVFDATTNVFNQNSGVLTLQNNASIGFGQGGNHSGTSTFNQNGGTVTFYSDAGTTVGGTGSVILGNGGSTGTYVYNLNGGTLTTPGVQKTAASASGTFNFNGGTLKAAANNTSFLQNLTAANVRNGGAIIDTAGFNVTAASPLQHSAISGDNPTDGGLTKNGAGVLTLAGSSTYTGNTTVNGGTLLFSGVGTMTSNIKNITVANGAGVGAGVGAIGTTRLTTTGISLGTAGGSTSLVFDFNSLANPTVPILTDTGALTIGSSTVAVSAINAGGLTSGTVTLLDYSGAALSASDFAKFNATVPLSRTDPGHAYQQHSEHVDRYVDRGRADYVAW
ncbi:MAG: autotransporter-associated beta strand repeat-containing protein [Pirellulales bacterium]